MDGLEGWGSTASKSDILRHDKPLPTKDNDWRASPAYYGGYSHLINWEYIEAIDYPLLQRQWRPGWGDIFCLRRDDVPNIQTISIWAIHTDGEKRERQGDYCWIPRLDQLLHIILSKELGIVIGGPAEHDGTIMAEVVRTGGLSSGEEYALTAELALALALRKYLQKRGKL